MAKKQRVSLSKGRPVQPATHVVVENVRMLGMNDGAPSSMRIGYQTGAMQGDNFVPDDLSITLPIDAAAMVAKDPALFKRLGELLTESLAEELGETAET